MHPDPAPGSRPVCVGVTVDLARRRGHERVVCPLRYAQAVEAAGATALLLPPLVSQIADHLARCDAFVLIGGDDPRMEAFGQVTHPAARPVLPRRQAYEVELLRQLGRLRPDCPVLGVCLGMQLMALCAGGSLFQHLPESHTSAAQHWSRRHLVRVDSPRLGVEPGIELRVFSRHRQAVADPGSLHVAARAADGLIEAVVDPSRTWYVGVQWHPERSGSGPLGSDLFRRLVAAALAQRRCSAPASPLPPAATPSGGSRVVSSAAARASL